MEKKEEEEEEEEKELEEGEIVEPEERGVKRPVPIETTSPPEDEGWMPCRADRRKAKKRLKNVLAGRGTRKDFFDVYGPDAHASIEVKAPHIRLKDVQDLILWVLGEGMSPSWVFVKNKPLVAKIVVIFAPGLDGTTYSATSTSFPHCRSLFAQPLSCQAPGSRRRVFSPLHTLLTVPLSRSSKKRRDHPHLDPPREVSAVESCVPPHPPSFYILTMEQLRDNEYPLANCDAWGGFVCTRPRPPDKAIGEQLVALDCEMCYTKNGLDLTRVTLIDEDRKVLYDQLILPKDPITDYNTRYSGITAEMMKDVTLTREDAQAMVLDIVFEDTILVGHSLENDLQMLHIIHSRVFDTALVFPHPRNPGRKPALRLLAEKFLNRSIQDSEAGHCSVQDAVACMDLAKLKILKGPEFGMEAENSDVESLFLVLDGLGRKCSLLDRPHTIRQHSVGSVNTLPCHTDEECVEKATKEINRINDFVFVQLHNLRLYQADVAHGDRGSKDNDEKLCEVMEATDRNIYHLYEASPVNTLFLVVTGQGNISEIRRLEQACKTPEDDQLLAREVERARNALVLLRVKEPS